MFNFVYYYYFEFFRSIYQRHMGRVGYRGNMVLATCAGACMQLTTLPLQNHSTRMQTQTEKRGNWATAVAMYQEEGLGAFYKGTVQCQQRGWSDPQRKLGSDRGDSRCKFW